MLEALDWDWLSEGIPARIHGDLAANNAIVTPQGGFVLLDWRENFGGLDFGDVYYDLAKFRHTLWLSTENIDKGLFRVRIKGPRVSWTLRPSRLWRFRSPWDDFVLRRGYDARKVEVLSALIYLNIAALHGKSYNRLLYFMGKDFLARLIERG